jgi:phosphomannomutase/phosphoglucomutase
MDIMNLKESVRLSSQKKVSKWVTLPMGLLGIAIIALSAWIGFSDQHSAREMAASEAEGREILEQLAEPVEAFKHILEGQTVQDLAVRAIDNPEHQADLFAYLHGRISEVSGVQVYGWDLAGLRGSDMGVNGYAKLDMALSAKEGQKALLQFHQVLDPPRMYDAVTVKRGDEFAGVMLVELDPGYFFGRFEPELQALESARLTQYNGRQPLTVIKSFGDVSTLGDVPDRMPVPGSLMRLEYPRAGSVQILGGGSLVLFLIAGVIFLTLSFVLFSGNRKWAAQQAKKAALSTSEPARLQPEPAHEVERAPEREGPVEPVTQGGEPPPVPDEVVEEGANLAQPESDPPLMKLHYDIAEKRRMKESKHQPVELKSEIFRAYDIRGVIDKTLDSGVARKVGQALGTLALEGDASPVVVARDGRLSGPYLMEGMIEGILAAGCDVLDIGAVPTGVLYYAAHELATGSGVMITGSHNPPDYNGFKVMIGGDTLHGDAITGIYDRIVSGRLSSGEGKLTSRDVVKDYIARIADDINVEKPLRVVIDCGNGIGGVCAADALRAIGVEVLPLFDEVDGTFPNHHPDPSEPENLNDLIESVRLMDADLGLALDGDADRLGVVTLAGNIIYPDRVMMLLALDVLDRNPGATIIYDVKCTGHLPDVIREAGGKPMMYKTGHSLIKAKMKEVGSPFAGEMSGHFFFKERWYGVDDGIYAAARLLEILGGAETPPEAILNALPTSYSTPELKVQMKEGENHDFIEAFRLSAKFEGAQISTIDGLRADFEDGWGLVRASNTTPILVVRFDAESEMALERIKESFRKQMLAINADLQLPF